MKVYNRILLAIAATVFVSCKGKEESVRDDSAIRDRYFQLEKIGWKSKEYTQKVDDINFIATEVPIQFYLLKDKGTEDLFLVDSLYKENKTERVLEFVYHQQDGKDLLNKDFTKMPFDDSLKYMAFGLDKDFYVVTSKKDTIACSGVNYERTYKIAPYQKVLLFFSGIDPNEKIQLVYNDHLFGKGTLKFTFKDTYTEIAL